MELKPADPAKTGALGTASDINKKNQRTQNEQPKVVLQSQEVREAIKNKREEKPTSETPIPGTHPNNQNTIQTHGVI